MASYQDGWCGHWYADADEVLRFAKVLHEAGLLNEAIEYFERPDRWTPEHERWVAAGRPGICGDDERWVAAGRPDRKQWRAENLRFEHIATRADGCIMAEEMSELLHPVYTEGK